MSRKSRRNRSGQEVVVKMRPLTPYEQSQHDVAELQKRVDQSYNLAAASGAEAYANPLPLFREDTNWYREDDPPEHPVLVLEDGKYVSYLFLPTPYEAWLYVVDKKTGSTRVYWMEEQAYMDLYPSYSQVIDGITPDYGAGTFIGYGITGYERSRPGAPREVKYAIGPFTNAEWKLLRTSEVEELG